jgi:rhodanese-related sulfurtransferase
MNSPEQAARRHAGDVNPREAWDLMAEDPQAQLVDVRTAAEWTFVGGPDLSSLGREAHQISWQLFPEGSLNVEFVRTARGRLLAAGADENTPVLFLCRSGGRSRAAAIAMAEAGFKRALNVTGGFEGELDAAGHRGNLNGWRNSQLPWRQS